MQLCQKPLSRCFEFLALFLFVLPWFCCKAFQPPLKVGDLKPNRLRLLLASLPSLEEEKMSTVIPNWRVIPANADDHGTHLIGRETWSEEQFSASLALYDRFMQCSDSFIEPGIKAALDTLDHAYRLYGPESVICSFNGGKDAIVILHLLRAAHAKYYNSTSGGKVPIRPRVIYFDHEDEFPEVTSFLKDSVNTHDLDMVAFEKGIKFANGLEILVQNNVLPGCNTTFPMAFVLGTRSSDPNAKGQDHFAPSSDWMPPFMRVNPVVSITCLCTFEVSFETCHSHIFSCIGTMVMCGIFFDYSNYLIALSTTKVTLAWEQQRIRCHVQRWLLMLEKKMVSRRHYQNSGLHICSVTGIRSVRGVSKRGKS